MEEEVLSDTAKPELQSNWNELNAQLEVKLEECFQKKDECQQKCHQLLSEDTFQDKDFVEIETTPNNVCIQKQKKIKKMKHTVQKKGLISLNFNRQSSFFKEDSFEERIQKESIDFESTVKADQNKTHLNPPLAEDDFQITRQFKKLKQLQKKDFVYETPVRRCKVVTQTLMMLFQNELEL